MAVRKTLRNFRTRAKKVSGFKRASSKAIYRAANGAKVDSNNGSSRAYGKVHHSRHKEGKFEKRKIYERQVCFVCLCLTMKLAYVR